MPDYYADAAPDQAEAPAKPEQESASDSGVATLPKSVLGGKEFKPGEEVVLKIVQVNEDSVLVQYASDEGEQEKEPYEAPPTQEAPAPGGGGMASLME